MIDTTTIPNSHKPLASGALEHLQQAARAAASWNVVHRPTSDGSFPVRVRAAQNALEQLEKRLASPRIADTATGEAQQAAHNAALGELRENYRMLRSAINGVVDSLRVVVRPPRILLHGN